MVPTLVRQAVLLFVCLVVAAGSSEVTLRGNQSAVTPLLAYSDKWCPHGYWKAWCGDTWECQVEGLPEQFAFWTCLRDGVTCKHFCKDDLKVWKPTFPWAVVDGECTIDAQGCLLSPNYPQQYSNNGRCIIDVSQQHKIVSKAFNTELSRDWLTINGQSYSGTDSPAGIVPSGEITWSTDGDTTETGFKLCPATGQGMWEIVSGHCSIDDQECLLSPNYPEQYDNNDGCRIEANHPQKIASRAFNTELSRDWLTINGQSYSGTDSPAGIVPSGEITWSTDGDTTQTGFKLCPLYPTSALAAFGPGATETTRTHIAFVAAAFSAISGLVLLAAVTGYWLRRREASAAVPLLQCC